ncbi:hypothetical protein [Achromobacter sp. UMC71]|uniref:hypothetical protein n=1 Tax=Achromobacter sp. UMC71 TaxID=1862320 RepID=UPI001602EE7D|nr:hypothetical protein [Achromobacter sp. UMC71]MBB1626840.1 hypothetical protein [Achromobacter sp. UMC71]
MFSLIRGCALHSAKLTPPATSAADDGDIAFLSSLPVGNALREAIEFIDGLAGMSMTSAQ